MNYSHQKYPFFIFGCGRSGTSLLSQMLNNHPSIAVPYESHLYNTFYPWIKYYGDLFDQRNLKRLIDDILSTDVMKDWSPQLRREEILVSIQTHDFGGVFNAIMNSWAKKQNKIRWGEKTPHHIYYWNVINKYIPNAQIIHLVRDGRDVGLSLLKARFGPKTIYSAAKYWVNYLNQVDKIKTLLNSTNYYEVRYEDLLENPEKILSEICKFLGESFSENMLNYYKGHPWYNTDKYNRENLQKPLLRDNKYKWRKYMDISDIRIFEFIAKDKLKQYGYEISIKNQKLSKLENLYYGYFKSPIIKIIWMLKNRKGHRDALIRIKILFRLILLNKILNFER